jgi:NADP-dependent 3-hydroxy acid dehydrogenase YdfG
MAAPKRIALVTGAGSGIGRQITLALLREGYGVALAGRRQDALEETVKLAGEHGANALVVAADVTDPASVKQLFARPASVWTPRHALQQCRYLRAAGIAGRTERGAVEGGGGHQPDRCFPVYPEAFRVMKDQSPRGGRIINNGSISAHAPRPFSASYTATKHAITGLTKATSLDGRAYDIACGQIDIGNASTDMTTLMKKGTLQADGSTKVEPTMDAEHVARAILYMDSLPLEANVQFMTVMATKMPYIGRG